jgi:hypothetical protein
MESTRPPPIPKTYLNPEGLTSVERGLDLRHWEYRSAPP